MSATLTATPEAPPVPTRAFTEAPAAGAAPVAPPRLVSLDAYRGFIMLLMASGGLGFATMAANYRRANDGAEPGPVLAALAYQFDHVPWVGCAFWDLIQPSFMFMVGVALPYSLASRRAKNESYPRMLAHAAWRSLLLVLLAVFLSSPQSPAGGPRPPVDGPSTNWIFPNVLAQIGLGYFFVFLLTDRGLKVQVAALLAILVGYTLFFGLYPLGEGRSWWSYWDKNDNAAHYFDVWFLNLFPRLDEFTANAGGYQTLNFVPSMATMIFGLMAGELLRRDWSAFVKLAALAVAGLACLAVGWAMSETVNPLVKRIWTPSWAVFSTGWTLLMLAAFYGVIDVAGWKAWAFPLVVVGMNSIAMYFMSQQMRGWVRWSLEVHFGRGLLGGEYGPLVMSLAILLVLWLVCFWMYRRKLFLRI